MLAALEERISMARRHVAIGRSVIVRQLGVIARKQELGFDASNAEELLSLFQRSQEIFEVHLEELLREQKRK